MTVQLDLCHTWSEIPKNGFLTLRLTYGAMPGFDFNALTLYAEIRIAAPKVSVF